MKTNIIKTLIFRGLFILSVGAMAQGAVPPPPTAGGHGMGANQPAGGGAPIGSGIGILLTRGAAYGGKEIYKLWKNKNELES